MAETTPASGPPLSFESALERLEEIVARLEQGELDLEEALTVFEEGVGLSRRCAEQLDAAERRIEVLVRDGDRLVSRPFEAPDAQEPDGD
jgi:exodeoxyribonuclease VII small subunit